MELLLIRHALPVRIDEGSVDGPADPALSDLGHAPGAAPWPSGSPTSTSTRSGAARCAAPARRRPRSRERLRPRGRSSTTGSPSSTARRSATSPIEELKAANDPRWYEVPEQPEHFRAVVVEAVERIVAAHAGQRVAVVCHGGVINAYAAHVLGIDDPLFFLPTYTSISRVFAASTGERSIASLNEAAHLRGLHLSGRGEGSVPPNRALELPMV